MEVLRLENLSKYYTSENSVVVGLAGINLSFSTGELVALTGESGSGKSTLAHVLGGIIPYESGELYIYGQPTSHYDAYDWSRYRRDLISFISQSYGILPGNTVTENIESALHLSGLSVEEVHERTRAILDEVELTEFKNRKAGKLSSGQKQRLSIARALAKPSKILIADEPTGNLDRENSEKVIALLKRASRDRLVILITHEFEEAKDVATRRIILSDGAVVTDAELAPRATNEAAEPISENKTESACDEKGKGSKKDKKRSLTPYVCSLTLRSRPIFSALLCLLLMITTFITFVFLGTFISWLDDSSTRIYDPSAFLNGDPERIVVMRGDGEPLTQEDYDKLISEKYVVNLERFSYSNDFCYHYKEGYDLHNRPDLVFGDNYDPISNPDDYWVEYYTEFFEEDLNFVRTLPYMEKSIVKDGNAPEGVFEVLSADPDLKIGDTVKVYIRDTSRWSADSYLEIDFKVVGTTSYGKGLYFSDKLAAILSSPRKISITYHPYSTYQSLFFVFPNDTNSLKYATDSVKLTDEDFVLSLANDSIPIKAGSSISVLDKNDNRVKLTCIFKGEKADGMGSLLVSDAVFEQLVSMEPKDQASIYIRDYSYSERVISSLREDGYVAISPYKLGATEIDQDLAMERLITLGVCAAVLVLSFILQVILLRSMFSSLHEYYRLMSNTGLTEKVANSALCLMILISTLIGYALAAGIIALLNFVGFDRVVDIFKYLDIGTICMIFAIHLLSIVFAAYGILRSLKRTVFGKGKSNYDIDFSLMEDSAV